MKTNLLTDLDGVYYDLSYINEPSILTAAVNAAKKLNLPQSAEQSLIEASKTRENFEMYRPFEDIANGDDYKMDVFNHEIVKITDYSTIPKNPCLLQIIKLLQLKYEITIVTDNSKPHAKEVFNALWSKSINESGIDIYSIEDAKQGKYYLNKKEGGLELFCKNRNISPENCLLIDDNQANINSANKIGMQTILFDNSQNINSLLTNLGSQ